MARDGAVAGALYVALCAGGLAAGTFLADAPAWVDIVRSASWVPVPAKIEGLNLRVTRGSKGRTHRHLSAAYSYEFEGSGFLSRRVGFSWDDEAYAGRHGALEECRRQGVPATAYVDPAAPSRAVLFRDVPLTVLFWAALGHGLIAGCAAGAALCAGAFVEALRRRRMRASEPRRPWRHDSVWADFRIAAESRGRLWLAWLLALYACAAWALLGVAILGNPDSADHVRYGALALAAAPLVLLGYAVWRTLHVRAWGYPMLHLARLPVLPGSPLEGTIVLDAPPAGPEGVRLRLACVRATTTGSGKSRKTQHETLHEVVAQVRPEDIRPLGAQGAAVPVRLEVPAGLPSTDPDSSPSYAWTLEATAAAPGVDLAATFPLPVFAAEPALVEARPDRLPGC